MIFSELLLLYRKHAELSQQELADRVGVHRHTIRNWEQYRNFPQNRDMIEKLAEVLDLWPREKDQLLLAAGFPPEDSSQEQVRLLFQEETISTPPLINNALVELHDSSRGLGVSVPVQRPTAVDNFIGREKELHQVFQYLAPSKIVTIVGPGGIGKSTIAAEAIRRLAPDGTPPRLFPDGIIYFSFYGAATAEDALKHIIESFGKDWRSTSLRHAAIRALSGRKALLVLDGAEEADDLPAVLKVRDLCGVLITTRYAYEDKGIIDVSSLPTPHAIALLQSTAGVWAEDEQVANEICQVLDGMPLAIQIAGKAMAEAGEEAKDYLADLKQSVLSSLSNGEHQQDNFRLLIERSVSKLSESMITVIRLMAALEYAPIDREALAAALGASSLQLAKNELLSLEKYGLIIRKQRYYHIAHSLVHKCIRELFHQNSPTFLQTIGLAAYYSVYATKKLELGQAGYNQLDLDRRHILTALSKCIEHEVWRAAYDLQIVLDPYLSAQGHWTDQIVACKAGLVAAYWLKERKVERDLLRKLTVAYYQTGNDLEAKRCEEQALAISEELGDSLTADAIRKNLWDAVVNSPQQTVIEEPKSLEDLTCHKEVLENWLSLRTLIYTCKEKKQWNQIKSYLPSLLEMAENLPTSLHTIQSLIFLSQIFRDLKQEELALDAAQLALRMACEEDLNILDEISSKELVSRIHIELAIIYGEREKTLQKKIHHYQMAIQLSPLDAFYFTALGRTFLRTGSIEKAEYCFLRRTEIRPFDALDAYVSLGIIALRAGFSDKATIYFKTALETWETANRRKIQSTSDQLEYKSLALLGLGYKKEAMEVLCESLEQIDPDLTLEDCDFSLYDVLAESPSPPSGLEEMRRILEEKIRR